MQSHGCRRIMPVNDVQNHPVIEGVPVVPVPPPAARPDMDFDIASLETAVIGDDRVTQVGAAVIIKPARVDYRHLPAVLRGQVGTSRQIVLPDFNDATLRKTDFYRRSPTLFVHLTPLIPLS